jgi:hypothetical protein
MQSFRHFFFECILHPQKLWNKTLYFYDLFMHYIFCDVWVFYDVWVIRHRSTDTKSNQYFNQRNSCRTVVLWFYILVFDHKSYGQKLRYKTITPQFCSYQQKSVLLEKLNESISKLHIIIIFCVFECVACLFLTIARGDTLQTRLLRYWWQ